MGHKERTVAVSSGEVDHGPIMVKAKKRKKKGKKKETNGTK